MIRKSLIFFLVFLDFFILCGIAAAQSSEGFEIEDIRVEGIERLDAGIIFQNLDLKIGDQLNPRDTGEIISKLFDTGVFQDVVLRREGNVLVIEVVENPTVSEIGFSGLDEFNEEQVLEQLSAIDVSKAGVLKTDGLERAVRLLEEAYLERAFYGVDIQPTATPLDRNRVRLDFEIREGVAVKIGEVVLYGAEAEDEEDVLEQMQLQPTNWLSWYNKDNVYSNSVFLGDVERIRDYYLARGYLRFEVLSSEVALSRTRDSIRIAIVIEEGSQYSLSGWNLSGNHEFDESELEMDLGLVAGEIYSARKIENAIQVIRRHLGNKSFGRATVSPERVYDDENNSAAVNFVIDTGKPIFVRRIDISGNHKTRDEVIRRELRQFEGAPYSAGKIEMSRRRLGRLGFFDEISFNEVEVEGSDDEIDLALDVEESVAGTGSLGFGLGFSRDGGVSFSGVFETRNIFGTGNDFGVNVSFSDTSDRFALNFDEPYITEYGVSRHIGISRSAIESSDDVTNYRIEGSQIDYGYGVPVGEETVLFVNAHYESDKLLNTELVSRDDTEAQDYLREHGKDAVSYLASASLTRDTRDSALAPTEGYRQSFSARSTLPVGDLRYYSLRVIHDHFFPLGEGKDYVLGLSGEVSHADSFGGTVYPFYKRFYLGGPSSLRGFEARTVGDKDSTGDALGGRVRIRSSADLYFPLPLISEFDGVRTSFFVDAGALYSDWSDFDANAFRSSAGLTIRWLSPLGPFKFILAKPIRHSDDDHPRTFDFTLGTF